MMFYRVFSILFFIMCATAHPDNLLQRIKDRGYLIVAMLKTDDPPFSMKDNQGNEVGVDIELGKEIAKHLEVKLQILRTASTYDGVVEQVASGKADLALSNLSITLKRAQKVNYSKQYIVVKKAILLNHKTFSQLKKTDDESLRSFFHAGNKLGVIKGSSYVEFSKIEFPQVELVFYDSWSSLIEDLDRGVIAGGFWDEFEVEKVLFFRPGGSFRYQAITLNVPTDKVAIAVQKSHQDFLNWINTFLDLKVARLTVKDLLKLYKKYEKT